MENTDTITYWQDAWSRLQSNRLAMAGLIILCALVLLAIAVPIVSPHTYYETHLDLKNNPPSWRFWFGTDELGRDLFIRVWWGARISLFVGVAASLIDLGIGAIYGATAAMCSKQLDEIFMRLADILYAIPYLLLVILLTVIIGPGIGTILLALTITGWINMARMVRGQILQLKILDFVQAAKMLGCSRVRLLFYHLLPNAMGPMIVSVTLTVPIAIFTEAFLSFLGLGVQAPIASLGTMASDGLSALRYYPWRLFCPAGLISLTMLSFNFLGDGLRDAFDPRLK